MSRLQQTTVTLMKVLLLGTLGYLVWHMFAWGVVDAQWGWSAAACTGEGACWKVISARSSQLVAGFYPDMQRWRLVLSVVLWCSWLFSLLIPRWPLKIKSITYCIVFALSLWLVIGDGVLLPIVQTHAWGGMLVTLVITIVGCTMAIPIGLLLALGRQSTLPVIRLFCIGFIEAVRGVPLITVLFMASVMFPLFVPSEFDVDKLLRALIGISLFQAAYLAEVFRGGLRAIPIGQYEACASLGLGRLHQLVVIEFPQMLRYCLPGLTNSVIALFKDTTLIMIIGIYDFLGIAQAAVNDPTWIKFALEIYVFTAIVYWIGCFGLSQLSKHIDRKLRMAYD